MSDLLRLLAGCVFLALAGLTAVAAPNQLLWKLSVAATEGGHWLAIGALVPAIPWWGQGRLGKLGGLMSLGAAALFALPLFYASQMNKDLPAQLDASFGTAQRTRGRFAEDLRPEPVVMLDLVSSVQSRPVLLEERVFNTTDGEKLTLDIYKPGYTHDPVPGLLVIHGGSWQSGHSKEFIALNAYLAARDYVVASINYRLAPKWKFPAGRDDVLSAIAYLESVRPRVRPRPDEARAAREIGRRSARAARRLHCQRTGDPRRHLGLRPDGSEVRIRATRRQGTAGHAGSARELSRRLAGEGRRRVLCGVADQLRDRFIAADTVDSWAARRTRLARGKRSASSRGSRRQR